MKGRSVASGLAVLSLGLAGLLALGLLLWGYRSIEIEDALVIAQRYLESLGNPDIAIDEIMEFEQNFYIIYYEKSTGIGAFEMLIDKSTGRIFPEPGPNMMWNTKYGHRGMMGGWGLAPTGEMPISEGEALTLAQAFLDKNYPGAVAEDAYRFYGYYTIHVLKGDVILGMLSVNGYSGRVWYHTWHGAYIQSRSVN